MIRCTEHTARREITTKCTGCKGAIGAGDVYRRLVAVAETDIFPTGFYMLATHTACIQRREAWMWEVRDVSHPDADPTCTYVRERYGLDVRKGSRVTVNGRLGTVEGATSHVYVHYDGDRRHHAHIHHPREVKLVVPAGGAPC